MELTKDWHFPKALQPIADRIQPRDIAVFLGTININKINLIEKWMINKVKAPFGDFRDWDAITSWTMAIADMLKGMFWRQEPKQNNSNSKEIKNEN